MLRRCVSVVPIARLRPHAWSMHRSATATVAVGAHHVALPRLVSGVAVPSQRDAGDAEDDSDGGDEREVVRTGQYAIRKADNPYLPFTTIPHKRAAEVPHCVTDGVGTVLAGRRLPDVRAHFMDMETSLEERNRATLKALAHASRGGGSGGSGGNGGSGGDPSRAPPLLYGPKETLAYVAHRMFPVYGVAVRVMEEVAATLPDWQPKSMLDFGAGTGTAVCAAREVWEGSVDDVVVVEPSRSMTQVAEHVLHQLHGVMYRRSLAEVQRYHRSRRYDVVVAHHTLSELCSDAERRSVTQQLWEYVAPGGVLILTDRGSRWGFRVIRAARQQLIDAELERQVDALELDDGGAEGVDMDPSLPSGVDAADSMIAVLAPCPHALTCPMHFKSWCHFSQRVQQPRHALPPSRRHVKYTPEKDEKFSYVVLHKTATARHRARHTAARRVELDWDADSDADDAVEASGDGSDDAPVDDEALEDEGEAQQEFVGQWAKIVRKPLLGTRHVIVDVCTPQGTMERRIPSKGKLRDHPGAYRAARKASWGGHWPNWLSRRRRKSSTRASVAAAAAAAESGV